MTFYTDMGLIVYPYKQIPGQSLKLQSDVSTLDPLHVFPPAEGSGLSHVRFLERIPFPHVTEHVWFDQELHAPSTLKNKKVFF